MDINPADSGQHGNLCGIFAVFLAMVTWFNQNGDSAIKIVTGVASIVTAIFACRYYYYATKEKKKNL